MDSSTDPKKQHLGCKPFQEKKFGIEIFCPSYTLAKTPWDYSDAIPKTEALLQPFGLEKF